MSAYLSLRDVRYSGPMSSRGVPPEIHFSINCLQEGRICPNCILLSRKVKHFKNILTKLVTHKRTLQSKGRRKGLIIINYKSKGLHQLQSKTKLEKKPRWEGLHVVEKLSSAKGHWEDPNLCIAPKWSEEDDEVRIQVFLVLPMPMNILFCLKNILPVWRKYCSFIEFESVQNLCL